MLLEKDQGINLYSSNPFTLLRRVNADNISSLWISNTGVGIYSSSQLHIMDFKENTFHITSSVYSLLGNYNARISPDGNYLMFMQNIIYQGSTRKIIFARIVPPDIVPLDTIHVTYEEGIGFMDEPDRFFHFTNRTLYIKKLTDFTTVKTIPTLDSEMGNIDACSNKMITRGLKNYHIYDLASGEIVETIPPQPDTYCFLSNGVVFFRYGSNYYLNRQ